MREMIERAAKAVYLANVVPGVTLSDESWALCDAYKQAVLADMARAALVAALDPSDEALRGLVRDAWNAASWTGKDPTRAVIEALHQSISPQTLSNEGETA